MCRRINAQAVAEAQINYAETGCSLGDPNASNLDFHQPLESWWNGAVATDFSNFMETLVPQTDTFNQPASRAVCARYRRRRRQASRKSQSGLTATATFAPSWSPLGAPPKR